MKYVDALATFWQRNAEIRHGHLPRTGDVMVPPPPPPPQPVVQPQPPTATAVPQSASMLSKVLPYVAGAAIGGGAMGVPVVLDWLRSEPPAVQQVEPDKTGSLYQYLEDRGDHLE